VPITQTFQSSWGVDIIVTLSDARILDIYSMFQSSWGYIIVTKPTVIGTAQDKGFQSSWV